ncbi:MAG: preprotein translocase subunit SecE [Solirubrobacteraceae bacterium]|nr:preprotein translocase subunit SecE [Solirubrobacteraceae bacterium]
MAAEDHDDERPRLTASPASGRGSDRDSGEVGASATKPAKGRGLARFPGFLRASWAELRRVKWPDGPEVAQGTGVVIVFCILAGLFLGGVDSAAAELVDFVI